MATQKVTHQCAECGTRKGVEVQVGQHAKPPICCGQPMKVVAQK